MFQLGNPRAFVRPACHPFIGNDPLALWWQEVVAMIDPRAGEGVNALIRTNHNHFHQGIGM